MKPCSHKRVEPRFWSRHRLSWLAVPAQMGAINPDAVVCRQCGEWLSLGPSNDEPEAVKVEIRAAEIAVLSYRGTSNCSIAELIGWEDGRNNFDHVVPGNDGQWSGWLARDIATHSEPQ